MPLLAGWLLLLSLALLSITGWDKLQAKRQGRRVPERFLLMLAGLGGALGLWLGMTWFRHKTSKAAFRYLAPVLALAQWSILIYWHCTGFCGLP